MCVWIGNNSHGISCWWEVVDDDDDEVGKNDISKSSATPADPEMLTRYVCHGVWNTRQRSG